MDDKIIFMNNPKFFPALKLLGFNRCTLYLESLSLGESCFIFISKEISIDTYHLNVFNLWTKECTDIEIEDKEYPIEDFKDLMRNAGVGDYILNNLPNNKYAPTGL